MGEEGYRCKKCKNDKYCTGKKPHNRRCTKCRYEESPTSGTMFDKVKFSLLKAFHIAFKISTKKKGMSSLELSHEFETPPKDLLGIQMESATGDGERSAIPLKRHDPCG